MAIKKINIGLDKLGHFFQQGYEYFEMVHLQKKAVAFAEARGSVWEKGKFGLAKTGVYSKADLEANIKGYNFFKALFKNPKLNFKIGDYVVTRIGVTKGGRPIRHEACARRVNMI